jgi:hypothetical protein
MNVLIQAAKQRLVSFLLFFLFSFCPSVPFCLFIHPFACLYACLSVNPSVRPSCHVPFLCLLTCPSVWLSGLLPCTSFHRLSAHLSNCLPVRLCVHHSDRLLVCLSVHSPHMSVCPITPSAFTNV